MMTSVIKFPCFHPTLRGQRRWAQHGATNSISFPPGWDDWLSQGPPGNFLFIYLFFFFPHSSPFYSSDYREMYCSCVCMTCAARVHAATWTTWFRARCGLEPAALRFSELIFYAQTTNQWARALLQNLKLPAKKRGRIGRINTWLV